MEKPLMTRVSYIDCSAFMKTILIAEAPDHEIAVHLGDPVDQRDLRGRIGDAEVILNGHTFMDAGMLDDLPTLQRIVFLGTGAGSYIDLAAAAKRGVTIDTIAGYGDRSVAEHAFALILAAARRVTEMDSALRAGVWEPLEGLEMSGRRLGILGFGGIGRELATMARGFGMIPLIWNRSGVSEEWHMHEAPLDAVLSQSDVVSLHLALTPDTHGFLDAKRLMLLKERAILVNTARGGLIDEAALVAALREGRLKYAALDVFSEEPLPLGHPLLDCDNVTLTAHAGFKTEAASRNLIRKALALL